MTGNHLADQEQKRIDDASKCPDCKVELVVEDTCFDGTLCHRTCPAYRECDCEITVLKCPRCGRVYEVR